MRAGRGWNGDCRTSRRRKEPTDENDVVGGQAPLRRSAALRTMRSGQLGDAASQLALGTGGIHGVQETNRSRSSALKARPGLPIDESRRLMMRRVKAMTLEQRLQLFERLSRDAAWIRSAASGFDDRAAREPAGAAPWFARTPSRVRRHRRGAMLFYGYVRNTEDLDIVVAPDGANLDRVAEWLTSLDAVLKLNPNRRLGPREGWGWRRAQR